MSATRPPADMPRPGESQGFSLPRAHRITTGAGIRRLLSQGKRWRTDHLDVHAAASPESFPRLGFVVAKHGHRIVERNRVKRRLREIGRIELLPRLRGCQADLDVLIRARSRAGSTPPSGPSTAWTGPSSTPRGSTWPTPRAGGCHRNGNWPSASTSAGPRCAKRSSRWKHWSGMAP